MSTPPNETRDLLLRLLNRLEIKTELLVNEVVRVLQMDEIDEQTKAELLQYIYLEFSQFIE